MKRIIILISLSLLIGLSAFAQKNKRTSAYMYNNNGEYAKAKEAIDAAILHEKTMSDAKTWLYRGEIYYNIAASDDTAVTGLAPDAADVALESLSKAKQFDIKGTYEGEISLYLTYLVNIFYSQAGTGFQNGEYDAAIEGFEKAFEIAEIDGRFDTIAAFNIGMAGVLSDNPEVAAEYLQKCIDVDYRDPRIYMFYNRSAKQLGDTVRALEIIKQGREVFPGDLTILLEEAQLYLEQGETEKLLASLKEAIVADPENANLYFLIGKSYDDMNDKVQAEEYYKKAGEINPEFFEAFYNMGAIYVNTASEYQAKANDLPLNETEKYDEYTALANAELEKAVPYLEKSLELKPDDVPTLTALKEAYARLKMNDKLEGLNK